jgi:hypothetical protein
MTPAIAQYISRTLGALEGRDPVAVLESTPDAIAARIAGRSPDQLHASPAPGKWSVAEVLAHLSEAEIVIGYRIRLILGANGTPVQAFDQDAWAVRYAGMQAGQSLEVFRVLRAANVALLRSLTAAQWEQYGMHSERGPESVAQIVRMAAGHDLNHLKQLESGLS